MDNNRSPSATPTSTSFAPPSPHFPLLELDENGVASLFSSLGFPFYQDQLNEHGITGEILVHLDHEALKDVGIHSVGQRLAILRSVYTLKVQQNIPVEAGHYVPPSEDMESAMMDGQLGVAASTQQVVDMLGERDIRIRNLEAEVQRMHEALLTMRDDATLKSTTKRPTVRSPTSSLFPHPLSNQSTLSRANSTSTQPRQNAPTNSALPDSPRSPMDSPRLLVSDGTAQTTHGDGPTPSYHLSPSTLMTTSPSEYHAPITSGGVLTPTTPTAPHLLSSSNHLSDSISASSTSSSALKSSTGSSSSRYGDLTSASSGLSVPSRPSIPERTGSEHRERERQADNPYKSFKVTLEDPCYKVLPAALKKYKINDDWRQYALFICYGTTERCLAYDEKPLLLFQKLKESNKNPVFMLRHIKDIKSPIAVASAKHAARRDKRAAGIGGGVDKVPTTNRDGVSARPTRLHHPPVLLPVGKDSSGKGIGDDDKGAGGLPPVSPREAPGYCIAIYPYLAEREDEFDVAVGDTFIIISKTKGWWVVHRDLGPTASESNPRKSAWVPAGCLLETTVPPLSLADTSMLGSSSPSNAANVPIEPQYVVSVSTPNVALMDYEKMGSDELDVKKGTPLRILKRYNHWSYAIKEDGHRGWIPSWFCGRIPRTGEGTPTTPTTAEGRAAASAAASSSLTTTDSTSRLGSAHSNSSKLTSNTLPPIRAGGGFMEDVSLLGSGGDRD